MEDDEVDDDCGGGGGGGGGGGVTSRACRFTNLVTLKVARAFFPTVSVIYPLSLSLSLPSKARKQNPSHGHRRAVGRSVGLCAHAHAPA